MSAYRVLAQPEISERESKRRDWPNCDISCAVRQWLSWLSMCPTKPLRCRHL